MILEIVSKCIYQYSNDVEVVLEQIRFSNTNGTYMTCKREKSYIWGMFIRQSIYNPDGWEALIRTKFLEYGMNCELQSRQRIFFLSLNKMVYPKEVIFKVVQADSYYCNVLATAQNGTVSKSYFVPANIDNVYQLREYIISIYTHLYRYCHYNR